MVQPFQKSPLGGNLGVRTATFYRLDPTGTTPVATILELANPFSPNKVGFDIVDSEQRTVNFAVTDNALQDFTSATSNVHKELVTMTIAGTLISSVDIPFVGSVGVPGIPGGFGGGLRADLLKLENLETIANERMPIMVVSPRTSMPKAFIESISTQWDPETGENTLVTVSLKEARIVSPLPAGAVVPDVAASATGNNAVSALGGQAPIPVTPQTTQLSTVRGVAPQVIPGFA